MGIHQISFYHGGNVSAPNDIDNILIAAQIFAKSYGLQPFKIINVDDENVQAKFLNGISNPRAGKGNTHLIVFAIKPVITRAHLNTYFTAIKSTKKTVGNSLSNYRKHIEGLIQNGGDGWASKQAHSALAILSSSAKQTGAQVIVLDIQNPQAFDNELDLERQGLTTHIAVNIILHTSNNWKVLVPRNKN